MNERYFILDYNGCVIATEGDIKGAYRRAARINRIANYGICIEISDRKTGEEYSLTFNSRRRAKEHGRNIFDRFSSVCDAFAAYEYRNSITKQRSFAEEMFSIGLGLI